MNIRLLKANEIDARVQSVKKTSNGVGCILLLYKDARCDMKILDEVFGALGWEREHQLINGNLFCTVRVWDTEKKMWISKQDVGTESNTEKEKGQASDSFKRACFNLGIGRELYTAPFTWIDLKQGEWFEKEDRGQKKYYLSPKVKFHVKNIAYNDEKEIIGLEIADSKGITRYKLGSKIELPPEKPQSHTEPKKQSSNVNTPPSNTNTSSGDVCCEDCGKKITEKVAMWSSSKYGKKLCMDCQKKESKAV